MVAKPASDKTSININSSIINERSILRKMSTGDGALSALFAATASVIPKAETKLIFSTPQTARSERRRLRFYNPQVS